MKTRMATLTTISPKAIAAVVAAIITYVLGQEVLDLPSWATLIGQAVLVALSAFAAPPGNVVPVVTDGVER